MKSGKTPAYDGLPAEFYKEFWDVICQLYLGFKIDRVKRATTIGEYCEGGIHALDVFCQNNALKASWVTPVVVEEELLWIKGQGEISLYRIPIIISTPRGILIAASEARKFSSGDEGRKFLAIRRSLDGGYKWKPQQFILDDLKTGDGLSLGAIVMDEEKDVVIIVYADCVNSAACTPKTTHILKSFDDGATWRRPINISTQIGTKEFQPGPGYGIQKKYAPHKGRLIVCGHGTISGDGVFCLLSDDHGDTWRYGGMIKSIPYNQPKKSGDFEPDECQPVELPDGSIIINARNQGRYHCSCRVVSRSFDGAESFSFDDLYFDETLIEPVCAASILYHNDVLFFSNPMSTSDRVNLNLQWSYDNGTTWAGKLAINPDYSGYSCMTSFQNTLKYGNDIFIRYERGHDGVSGMDSLSLVRVRLHN
ncbi:sialidase-1-like [Glandiceps talaboti]